MRIDLEQEQKEKQRDYEQDILEAKIESLLAGWETAEPFHFTKVQEGEEVIVANPPRGNLAVSGLARGLLLYNIVKESLINPNTTTIISKRTGRIIHHPSDLP